MRKTTRILQPDGTWDYEEGYTNYDVNNTLATMDHHSAHASKTTVRATGQKSLGTHGPDAVNDDATKNNNCSKTKNNDCLQNLQNSSKTGDDERSNPQFCRSAERDNNSEISAPSTTTGAHDNHALMPIDECHHITGVAGHSGSAGDVEEIDGEHNNNNNDNDDNDEDDDDNDDLDSYTNISHCLSLKRRKKLVTGKL
jgi:hypothetical protein